MQVKHVVFDSNGCYLMVPRNGKTGNRRVIIRDSVPLLTQYLNNHPQREDPESPLWLANIYKQQVKPLSYPAARKMLKEAAKRAGVKKRVNPHSFRHASATNLASKVSESVMKKYFGWTQESEMAAVYVHLSGRDVDEQILRARGVEVEDIKEVNPMAPIKCVNCGSQNPPSAMFCMTCHLPPTDKALQEKISKERAANKIMELAEKNPKALQALYQILNVFKDDDLIVAVEEKGMKVEKIT